MDGTIADNQEDIKQEAVNCFFTFLNHVPEDFREVRVEELNGLLNYECIEEDRNMLMRRVTEEEVRKVVNYVNLVWHKLFVMVKAVNKM